MEDLPAERPQCPLALHLKPPVAAGAREAEQKKQASYPQGLPTDIRIDRRGSASGLG